MNAVHDPERDDGLERDDDHESGSVTVVMVAVVSALLVLTVAGLLLAGAVLASHRARAAGDLAALAASGVLMNGGSSALACRHAGRVATANHAKMQGCTTAGTEANLSVSVAAPGSMGAATARARAGPLPR